MEEVSRTNLLPAALTKHNAGTWQFPGGHLDLGESYFACAERETLEETGLVVRAEKLITVTNDIFDPASKHYITIFVLCRAVDVNQEPKVCCISVTGHLFPRC